MRLADYNYRNDYLTAQSTADYKSKKYYEVNETELHPVYNHQKSFYGKARIINNGTETLLRSYDTIVCKIDSNGNFEKLWNDYSVTTMAHINEYRRQNGMEQLNKKAWLEMEVK